MTACLVVESIGVSPCGSSVATKSPRHPARVPSVFGGSLRLAPVPPRSSVLPPGAGNEAKKAGKTEPEGPKYTEERYVDQTCAIDGNLHAPSITGHSNGDVAAIPMVEQAQRDLHSAERLLQLPAV